MEAPHEEKIDIDTFKKVDIRVGEVRSAEKIEGSEKLLRLEVYFGGEEERQIVSGIAVQFPDPQTLVGKKIAFAYNLAPRSIMGLQSDGMILAASGEDGSFSLLEAPQGVPGARVR